MYEGLSVIGTLAAIGFFTLVGTMVGYQLRLSVVRHHGWKGFWLNFFDGEDLKEDQR